MAQDYNPYFVGHQRPGLKFLQVPGLDFNSWLRHYYIGNLEVSNDLIQFWNTPQQLNSRVHIAGVADVNKSISLRDLGGFFNIHGMFCLYFSCLLELFSCFCSHYYESASFWKGQQRFVVLRIIFITLIILALKRTFKFLGGMSVIAKTLAWKSSKLSSDVCSTSKLSFPTFRRNLTITFKYNSNFANLILMIFKLIKYGKVYLNLYS